MENKETASSQSRVTIYPRQSIEHKLGFDVVRASVAELCVTGEAVDMVHDAGISDNFALIRNELTLTEEMCRATAGESAPSFSGLTDMTHNLTKLKAEGAYLEEKELGELRSNLRIAKTLADYFTRPDDADNPYPLLGGIVADIVETGTIIRGIDSLLSSQGTVKDTASATLHDIRRQLASIGGKISAAMRRVLSAATQAGLVTADTRPAVRNDRLVIPVDAANKRKIAGIVHDESATGKTVFIEPSEVVELGNEARQLEIEERREIIRLLVEFALTLRPRLSELLQTAHILARLDFIHAKALYALRTGGNLPELTDKPLIQWHDACHPVLKLSLESRSKTIVPLDIDLTAETARILVVSGPNAGGKSVALKTVGINQYMLQCGFLPVMDSRSRAGIFDGIFASLGDDQSIEDDLSTYSSHLRGMKYILNHGTDRSLILIDEFGSGTEPQIGGAIAQALLDDFNAAGMWGIVTTHYQNLKQMASETPGIMNGSMVYDRQHMKPTFRLVQGNPGSSFAVEIALRTGLPRSIIDKAETYLGSDYLNLDKYLLDINRDRRYWENKRADIKRREKHLEEVISKYEERAENLRARQRDIIDQAKTEADNLIARSNAAIERTIHEVRRAAAEKEQVKALRQELADERLSIAKAKVREVPELRKAPKPKRVKQKEPETETVVLSKGDNVLLDGQGVPGEILEISGKKALVMFGVLKTTVELSRLTKTIRRAPKVGSAGTSQSQNAHTAEASRQRQLAFKTEIDVRGMRADEALQHVTHFVDDALQFNAGRIRILHGTGTGALRMAIRQYLATVNAIQSYHDEDVRFGGAGITVVELS